MKNMQKKKTKKNGQRRRDSAVCRTELLDSIFFGGALGPHGAPQKIIVYLFFIIFYRNNIILGP